MRAVKNPAMLPPDFAAFSFDAPPGTSDAALAEAVSGVAGDGARVCVAGAGRWSLLVALAARGLCVVAFDPSRIALRTARDGVEHAGVADRVTLFAADPRDVVVPGGVDVALVTSFSWRVLLTREAQEQMLECLARAVAPGGALLLDVDRLPQGTTAETERTFLRKGPGGQTWTWRRDPARAIVNVACESPRAGPIEVDLSDVTPEASAELARAAGFEVSTSPLPGATGRRIVVCRVPVA